jgi:hypothetical protein
MMLSDMGTGWILFWVLVLAVAGFALAWWSRPGWWR